MASSSPEWHWHLHSGPAYCRSILPTGTEAAWAALFGWSGELRQHCKL